MKPRIRTVKPEFFKHEDLFDLEQRTGFPMRVAFAGLWCLSDREGRFEWRPRVLKLDILPWDDIDFDEVLRALESEKFVVRYAADGKEYGWIPKFLRHQCPNAREEKSKLPEPPGDTVAMFTDEAAEFEAKRTSERTKKHARATKPTSVAHEIYTPHDLRTEAHMHAHATHDLDATRPMHAHGELNRTELNRIEQNRTGTGLPIDDVEPIDFGAEPEPFSPTSVAESPAAEIVIEDVDFEAAHSNVNAPLSNFPTKAKGKTAAVTQTPVAELLHLRRELHIAAHGVEPFAEKGNAKINGMLSGLVKQVGLDEATVILEYFYSVPNDYYKKNAHELSLMVRDAAKLSTEVRRRAPIEPDTRERSYKSRIANASTEAELIRRAAARGEVS